VWVGHVPTPIETVPNIDHERFRVREPSGRLITFFSSHVAGSPVQARPETIPTIAHYMRETDSLNRPAHARPRRLPDGGRVM